MLTLPIETENHLHDMIVIILTPDNLERMKKADPGKLDLSNIHRAGYNLHEPTIMLCYEEPTPEFNRLMHLADIHALLKYLLRGWKFQPEKGDHDRGPESVKDHN
jgi:hypothetical protein